jgi:hypothetical protein
MAHKRFHLPWMEAELAAREIEALIGQVEPYEADDVRDAELRTGVKVYGALKVTATDGFQDAMETLMRLMTSYPTGGYRNAPLDYGDITNLRALWLWTDEKGAGDFLVRWVQKVVKNAEFRH